MKNTMTEQEFLIYLEKILLAQNPLEMNKEIPENIFDSTGRLILITAFTKDFDINITIDDIMFCDTPQEVYALYLEAHK